MIITAVILIGVISAFFAGTSARRDQRERVARLGDFAQQAADLTGQPMQHRGKTYRPKH